MEYIKFRREYVLTEMANAVFTEELSLKWACEAVFPKSRNNTLWKFTLLSSDPGVERRFESITMRFVYRHNMSTLNFNHYNNENLVELSIDFETSIKLSVNVHIPNNSENAIAGYDFTDKNKENDMILSVEEKKFHINKAVLSAYSPFFDNLFNNANFVEFKKNVIELKELDAKEFEVLLQVIYPTNAAVNGDNVEFLCKLADRFDIVNVFKVCEKFLCNMEGKQTGKLSIDNRMRVAELYNSEKLKAVLYQQMEHLNI